MRDVSDKANLPPTAAELERWYNLEAAKVWREDGFYIDWNLIPDVPVRVLEWDVEFWRQVDPALCAECGREEVDTHGALCLECRWAPFGADWQEEQAERDGLRWLRTHRLA